VTVSSSNRILLYGVRPYSSVKSFECILILILNVIFICLGKYFKCYLRKRNNYVLYLFTFLNTIIGCRLVEIYWMYLDHKL